MTSRILVTDRDILCYRGLPSPLLTSRQSHSFGRQFYGCAKRFLLVAASSGGLTVPHITLSAIMGIQCFLRQGAGGESEAPERRPMGRDLEPPPTDPRELISSDDEIDYSIKPEFYDPLLDVKDEQWMNKQRKGRTSDAVLSCPACFTTLCFDCQRHEKYVTQYRAMFVVNCTIRTDQILREQSKSKRKSKKLSDSGKFHQDYNDNMVFHPVCCSVCSTEVGVFDKDEVYHFFNVIPSNS
ncbi:E2F-associated phosphoprotein [Phalaenopsis equestris]|uniref:E2F-associated phosphoprotein n=1 Tax=Phalaenopsis equestris TaxID=78828 RepID=UPI0009E458C0|nr:E2F-associated phosphoprotein [Phalaenopsis equestris]